MASPAPTYDFNLILIKQDIAHFTGRHLFQVTYAARDAEGVTDGVAAANIYKGLFADAWKGVLDDNAEIQGCEILYEQTIGGSTTPLQAFSNTAAVQGQRAGSYPPPNCNLLVQKRTDERGKRARGRVYIPYVLLESDIDEGGGLLGSARTALQTRANDWLDSINTGADFSMVICNRYVDDNPTAPPAKYVYRYGLGPDVTSLNIDAVIGSQRRRVRS